MGARSGAHLEVVCRRVNDREVVLLVPCRTDASASALQPSERRQTFNRVRLDELGAVREESLGDGLPGHALRHAQVDVRRGQLVDMEPNVLGPGILDQVFICRGTLVLEFTRRVVDQE